MPGGWTVIERTTGRRFRCRYATVTDVRIGVSPFPLNTARHCRYRAFGLAMGALPPDAAAGAQALHASSGVSVFPLRVKSSNCEPFGTDPCQRMAPQVATICASRGSDSYVPRAARSDDSLNTFPGLAVAK